MSVATRFDKFLANIELTATQQDDAATKIRGISRKLHSSFYPGTEYTSSTSLIFGSYAKRTNIRPARDVDLLFKLPIDQFESNTTYNFQSYLLQKVKRILLEAYPSTDIKGDGPVVVVNFSGQHFVEVLPAFPVSDGMFLIPYTSGGGSWKVNAPLAELADIEASDERSNGNTKKLIKMIKKWQSNCDAPIKSLAIERRAVHFLASYEYYNKSSMWFDWMIRDYFFELIARAGATSQLPGLEEKVSYGDTWQSKAETAYERAVKACDFESSDDETMATIEWKKIFGDDFWFNS